MGDNTIGIVAPTTSYATNKHIDIAEPKSTKASVSSDDDDQFFFDFDGDVLDNEEAKKQAEAEEQAAAALLENELGPYDSDDASNSDNDAVIDSIVVSVGDEHESEAEDFIVSIFRTLLCKFVVFNIHLKENHKDPIVSTFPARASSSSFIDGLFSSLSPRPASQWTAQNTGVFSSSLDFNKFR